MGQASNRNAEVILKLSLRAAPLGNAVKDFDATRLASGRSLRARRCSLRELYGTYAKLSLIEQHLLGGGVCQEIVRSSKRGRELLDNL